jgi:hypothetical protein
MQTSTNNNEDANVFIKVNFKFKDEVIIDYLPCQVLDTVLKGYIKFKGNERLLYAYHPYYDLETGIFIVELVTAQ